MLESSKHALICVVTTESLPAFLSDEQGPVALEDAGHRIIVLYPAGERQLAESLQGKSERMSARAYDNESGGVIRALNGVLADCHDGKTQDLVLVGDASCAIAPTIIADMQSCMYRFERRAIGCPRTDIDGWAHLDEADATFARDNLPSVTRLPFPTAACAYLKGRQLALFGSFDESFLTLEGALQDFALRINAFGFDSIMLNHVFVPRTASTSFQTEELTHEAAQRDEKALASRYNYLNDAVATFNHIGIDPVDRFMPLIRNHDRCEDAKPRILLDFSNIPPFHCGTSEYQMGLVRCLFQFHREQYDLHVFANEEGAAFHHLGRYCDNIVYDEAELGVYDLGFYSSQPNEMFRQVIANRHCARMVYTMLDTILLRCHYIDKLTPSSTVEAVRCGLEHCDGIITISDYSKQDMLDYYENDRTILDKPIRRIYVASDFGAKDLGNSSNNKHDSGNDVDPSVSFPFSDYILIAGNHFSHKALPEAVEALKNTEHNYIVFGHRVDEYLAPNVFGYLDGRISDEMLESLYRNCSAFVFPSVYEGFGLPIVNALKCGKTAIVNRNQLNLEIQEHLGDFANNLLFFDRFDELPALVDEALGKRETQGTYCDSWESFTNEFCAFIGELLAQPLDLDALRERHYCYAVHEQEACKMEQIMQNRLDDLKAAAPAPTPAPVPPVQQENHSAASEGRRKFSALLHALARNVKK